MRRNVRHRPGEYTGTPSHVPDWRVRPATVIRSPLESWLLVPVGVSGELDVGEVDAADAAVEEVVLQTIDEAGGEGEVIFEVGQAAAEEGDGLGLGEGVGADGGAGAEVARAGVGDDVVLVHAVAGDADGAYQFAVLIQRDAAGEDREAVAEPAGEVG